VTGCCHDRVVGSGGFRDDGAQSHAADPAGGGQDSCVENFGLRNRSQGWHCRCEGQLFITYKTALSVLVSSARLTRTLLRHVEPQALSLDEDRVLILQDSPAGYSVPI